MHEDWSMSEFYQKALFHRFMSFFEQFFGWSDCVTPSYLTLITGPILMPTGILGHKTPVAVAET